MAPFTAKFKKPKFIFSLAYRPGTLMILNSTIYSSVRPSKCGIPEAMKVERLFIYLHV
jgi:hypothetical protein